MTVQDELRQVGIDVEVQALEWSSFLEAIHSNNPDWDMYLGGWSSTIDPQIMFTLWRQQNIPNNRLKGIEPTALGIGWNSEDWYIQEDTGS